jgi:hypothetical protein
MLFSATSTQGTFGVSQTLITNFMPEIIFICGILFFVLIVGIIVKMAGGEVKEEFSAENDELFTDEI